MKAHRSSLILILGILGILVCSFCAIFAWVMGKKDLAEMDAGLMDPEGRDQTKLGMVIGIVGTILLILSVVGVAIAIAVMGPTFFELFQQVGGRSF